MTAYNDLRFIGEAVDSILRQEFRDLELIIVDDGSGQDEIFGALAQRDPRIRIIVNPSNIGTAAAANRGIEAASADIIVRLDADDIAEPTRVARLVEALDDDPQLGLVGSWCTSIDEAGRPLGVERMPETDLEIRWTILFHNPFFHSTVAFRRRCFEAAGRYEDAALVSQDHHLWFHLLPLGRTRNIPEPLARYRWNPRGLTASHTKNFRDRTHWIREASWARLGLTYDLYDDALAYDISQFVKGFDIADPERRAAAYRIILTVLRAFLQAPRPFARADDVRTADRLARATVARMLANPPPGRRERATLWRLCWATNRRATIKAMLGRP